MKRRGGSSNSSTSFKTMHMLGIVLLLIAMFGSLFVSFFKFSDNKTLYEKFTTTMTIEYYYNPNCGPCKTFNPTWEEFVDVVNKTPNKNYTVVKYDVTDKDNGGYARSNELNINSTPTIVKVVDGKIVEEFNKERNKANLIAFANSV